MTLFQRYVFRQALWPFLTAIAALTGLAVLTQSLSNFDLIVDEGETALTFLYVTLLALPQILGLLLPIAVFLACVITLNRLMADSELVVGAAAGMSRRQRLAPFLRLAVYALLLNLVVNLFVQPAAFREMRRALYDIRTDVAASFMRPGEFAQLGPDVTVYARTVSEQGVMSEVFIEDARAGRTYSARQAYIAESDQGPVMVLEEGVLSQLDASGQVQALTFDAVPVDLAAFIDPTAVFFFKESDKYLPELLDPTPADIARARGAEALLAEGHYRLSAPLYCLAFALIAAAAFLSGEHTRTGYGRAIVIAGGGALVLRLVGFAVQAAAADDDALNPVQYLVPVLGMGAAVFLLWRPDRKRDRPAGPPDEAAPGGAAPRLSVVAGSAP